MVVLWLWRFVLFQDLKWDEIVMCRFPLLFVGFEYISHIRYAEWTNLMM